MSKELPSIEDFANNNNLPSVNEFIKEEVENQLPSVEDYVEKEEIEEIVEESVAEETESLTDLTEIIRLINDVRKDIPEIPEVKYYDDELERLCEIVDQVRSEVIDSKYYDKELERLQKNIQEVRSEIPIFPKWINEVNSIPDFSWIGKTITILDSKTSSIEDDFTKVNDSIETFRERIEINIKEVIEENDVKHFENKVEIRSEIKDLEEKYKELKEKIWKELGDTSLKIWEYHKEFKDDDRKLKKQIFGEYNSLKNNLEEKIKEFNDNSVKTDELLLNYFKNLKEEVLNLPEVKYYDNQIDEVNNKIENLDDRLLSLNELYDIVESIKSSQTELKEQLLTQPPSIDNEDSLTPLDQNFATLEDLSSHYRLFINRIQQQLATIGGGGETRLEFLDDVDRNTAKTNGYVLQYDSSVGKFIGTSYVSGSGGDSYWSQTNAGIYTTGNVAIGTDVVSTGSTALWVEGDARITGILSVGTGTITLDPTENTIKVGTGITLDATNNKISIGTAITLDSNTGVIEVQGSTIGSPTGDASYTGIVTASAFVGDGSLLTNISSSSNSEYATSAGIATYASSSGIATYATSAGISTQTTRLQNSRTFEITGDIIASPISFDGAGNVSLAATIQPNSVSLGSDTTGDYVSTITGTSNQITVTSGTGEGSTPILSIPSQFTAPQDVTVTRDLQVNRNLNVNGNITIGGTSATLFTTEFKVYDPDIVLGFRTDGSGNDISTDNTANHGGIAIASTEGTPLISLYDVGVGETNPATYKKFMWFKLGTFSGLGTDAWLSNYAVGIGSTQFPTGTRLAAGSVQFTENDLAVVRNINASGIITANTFYGDGSNLDNIVATSGNVNYADVAGIATYADTAGIATYANISGIATYAVTAGVATYADNAGIATYTSEWTLGANGTSDFTFTGPGFTGAENDPTLYLVRGQQYKFTSNLGATHPFRIQSTPNGSTGTQYNDGITNNDLQTGTLTWNVQFDSPNILYYQCTNHGLMGGKIYILNENVEYVTSAGIATYASTAGISTISGYAINAGIATYASSSGIATVAQGLTGTPNINVGIVTATSYNGSGINLTGIVTSITAGSGISVDQSTGNVTITATGGGGGGAISIKDEGSILGTAVTSINFVGSGVIATGDNSEVTVTIDGGGGSNITIQDEGSTIGTAATTINFVGSGVSASYSGGITTVTVSSTGGGTSVSMGITAPTSPSSGNLWYNSNLARTFIYYDDGDSSQWVDASPFNYGESNIGMSKNVVSYVATEAQTTFSATYNVGFVDVFLNGVKLSEDQYTASNGTSIVLNDGVSLNDIVEIVGFVGGIIGVGIATVGGTVGTGVTLFDFRGPGISTVTVSSGIGTINITGGTVTSSLTIGTRTTAQTINLVGVGATILLRSGIGTLNF